MFTAVATRCFMLCNFQTTDDMNIFIGIYIILVGTIKQTNCLRVVLWNCTAGICFCVSNFIGAHFPCSVDGIIGIWYGIFQLGIVRVFWSHLYIYNIHMYLCIYVSMYVCICVCIYTYMNRYALRNCTSLVNSRINDLRASRDEYSCTTLRTIGEEITDSLLNLFSISLPFFSEELSGKITFSDESSTTGWDSLSFSAKN